MPISDKLLFFLKASLPFTTCCIIVFCTIGCRSYPKEDRTKVLSDLPFEMDSLRHYGSIEFKKWSSEEMKYADSTQEIKYYEGGVLLQAKPKLQSSDTIYFPNVEGVPREKLNTLSRQVPSRDGYRLVSIPPEYSICALDSTISQTTEFCRTIHYVIPPVHREVITYRILNPKYEKDYPDGLPMKMKIYNHTYSDDITAVSWKKWEEIRQDSSSYFSHAIPSGYYSVGCTEDFETQCQIMQLQQALINRGYDIPLSGKMDKTTEAALSRFSKDNGLPIPQNGNILIWFPELSED